VGNASLLDEGRENGASSLGITYDGIIISILGLKVVHSMASDVYIDTAYPKLDPLPLVSVFSISGSLVAFLKYVLMGEICDSAKISKMGGITRDGFKGTFCDSSPSRKQIRLATTGSTMMFVIFLHIVR